MKLKINLIKIIWIIAVIGIISNLFDGVTTYIALQNPHNYENNSYMRFFLENPFLGYSLKLILGTWVFLPLKYTPYWFIIEFEKEHKSKSVQSLSLIFLVFIWIYTIYIFTKAALNNLSLF